MKPGRAHPHIHGSPLNLLSDDFAENENEGEVDDDHGNEQVEAAKGDILSRHLLESSSSPQGISNHEQALQTPSPPFGRSNSMHPESRKTNSGSSKQARRSQFLAQISSYQNAKELQEVLPFSLNDADLLVPLSSQQVKVRSKMVQQGCDSLCHTSLNVLR